MTSNQNYLQRLPFIKYLFSLGLEQSLMPEPMCYAALLTFHDAIELFLDLAAEHERVNKPREKIKFMDYFFEIESASGKKLTQVDSVEKLNKARVNLKHYGNYPNRIMIEGFRFNTLNFFEENTPLVFGMNFNSISLANLVKFKLTQNRIKNAEKLLTEGNLEESLGQIGIAFEQLLIEFDESCDIKLQWGYFDFFKSKISIPTLEYFDSTSNVMASLQNAVKILSLGLSYLKYVKFQALIPWVYQTANEKWHITEKNQKKREIIEEDVKFCINFVIESAIHLQNIDFSEIKIP